MPELVTNGAQLACTFGTTPSSLVVVPAGAPVQAGGQVIARVADMIPMTNVLPFGMCTTPTNPQVASATSAASGVLTPQPCLPAIAGPWTPGSPKVSVGGVPAVTRTCRLTCAWGGQISVVSPGQVTVSG
jgi:hypothetical protein